MSEDLPDFLELRVSEAAVARVLTVIAAPPNQHKALLEGDVEGNYDFGFAGGAGVYITGSTRYVFRDGATAEVAMVPRFSVHVGFPDGRQVAVRQLEQ